MTTDTIETVDTSATTARIAPAPARARPVFSTEDFALLRTAVAHYATVVQNDPQSIKFANLYHRLGRLN